MRADRSASSTPAVTAAASERRTEAGMQFDPATGRLALGSSAVDLPDGASNRAVLLGYLDLMAACRGRSVAECTDVRQADIDGLAAALDLEAEDLARQITEVLGATRAEAIRLVTRLKQSRVIGGITKAATAAAVAGAMVGGAGAVTASAGTAPTPRAPAPATASADPATTTTTDMTAAGGWQDDTEPVIDGPLTVDENGVGLIPPVTEDASGAVLVPPTETDAAASAGS